MRILVLGGTGWIGSIITRALAESPEVSEVIIGDLAVDKAKQLITQIGSDKLSVKRVDVTDRKELVNAMKGMDSVANATWYEFCLKVTEASIEAGVNMTDLGGMPDLTLKQLELDNSAKDAGITNLIGCGETPGISNILAKCGADKLDRVEEIHIRDGEFGKSSLCWLQHSVRTSIEELTAEAIIYEKGKYRKVPPRSGREIYKFPDPIGKQECYYVPFEEAVTLPCFLGKTVKTIEMKVTISPDMIQAFDMLEGFGLTRTEPIRVRGVNISPIEFLVASLTSIPIQTTQTRSYSCIAVDVVGTKGEEKVKLSLSAMTEDYDRWGVDGEGYKTAISAAIGAEMLARGDIKAKGVLPPEACIEPEPFIAELTKRNIRIQEKMEKL